MIEDPMIPFQQMTNSQILHYILYFPLNNFFFWNRICLKNFKISKNNIYFTSNWPIGLGSMVCLTLSKGLQ